MHDPQDSVPRDDALEVFETADGSKTLRDIGRGVTYRSKWGAITESRHVFLEGTGLLDRDSPWRVLELGFGAAVNFTQTVEACLAREGSRLVYHSVDRAPPPPHLLDFHDGLGGELAREALAEAHGGGRRICIESSGGHIRLVLHVGDWREIDLDDFVADAVYHDPFARRTNPASWTPECFAWERDAMSPTAVLATYSAATPVRSAIFAGGLWAARADGPGRKREMTLAASSPELLRGHELLDREHYLMRRSDR